MSKTDGTLFQKYLEEIGYKPLLSDEQEKDLAARVKAGDAQAINELVSNNLRYVVTIANQYANQGLSIDDLVSEGNVGLMKAASKYRDPKGKRFVVFAAPFIREAMEKAIDQQTGLRRVPKTEASKVERLRSRMMSMDDSIPAGSQNNYSLLNILEDPNVTPTDTHIERESLSEELLQAMNVLNERERIILREFYGLGGDRFTMAEIAAKLNLKRERVRQVRNTALRKLRRASRQSRP
ncbi:MAG: sigma-70 family RNA polymerase sigma factor [Prevotella sp.]|nr:sigma-70 family RNA polymerase sigma factor [Prevotella sp.]